MPKPTLPENFQDDVLAASMGGKRRYRLIHNSDGTVSLEDATTYTQVGSNFGSSQVNNISKAVNASLATDGNASNVTNSFSQASARSNLSTGEKLSVSLGKIMKWFADLKDSAFRSVANNLTTSSSGNSVLDAYQGYLLNNNKVATSNVIDTLSDVVANTQSKKPAGSLALKAAYNELKGGLSNKATSKFSSTVHYCQNVKNMVVGQVVLESSAGSTAKEVFTKAQLNSIFGVSNCSEANTVIFFCNNDGSASDAHFDGATYLNGKWYVVASEPWGATQIRVGYLAIYFG